MKKKRLEKHEDIRPAVAAQPEDSHAEFAVKCSFCDRPAVTVVNGYPVCQEHADMLYKKGGTPVQVSGKVPRPAGRAPPAGPKRAQRK